MNQWIRLWKRGQLLSNNTLERAVVTLLHPVPSQIQDARNHVNQAIYLLTNRDVDYQFKTGSEVLKVNRMQSRGDAGQGECFVPILS